MEPEHQGLPRRQRLGLSASENASRGPGGLCSYSDGNRKKISPDPCFYPQRQMEISFDRRFFDRRYFELSGKSKTINCFIDSMIYFLFTFFLKHGHITQV